jgi:[acyl-carrier-protein] S-malonyltransferase
VSLVGGEEVVLVFTFPGQGSQRSEMGRSWVDHPSWEVVDEGSTVAGRSLADLLLRTPMDELTLTANAQMATFVQSLVVLDAVERLGLSPGACAGHSLGEYTALVAAGALSFEEGLGLVATRGDAMARAIEDAPGTMAALMGISDDDAEAACSRAEGDCWVANYNAPGQVIIAGTSDAVARVSELARGMGARRVMAIPVGGAFHTPLMGGARPALRKALGSATFVRPEVPVVANVDARAHEDPSDWPALLSAQLCAPVRWRQTIETLAGLGATTFVELGPGGVLTGLAKRVAPDVRALSVATPDDLDALMDAVAAPAVTEADKHPQHEGEHLYMSERVVVSPAGGVFTPEATLAAPGTGLLPGTAGAAGSEPGPAGGHQIAVGDLVGTVGDTEVRTPFSGHVVRWLAAAGERVQPGQPVLWLRVPGSDR